MVQDSNPMKPQFSPGGDADCMQHAHPSPSLLGSTAETQGREGATIFTWTRVCYSWVCSDLKPSLCDELAPFLILFEVPHGEHNHSNVWRKLLASGNEHSALKELRKAEWWKQRFLQSMQYDDNTPRPCSGTLVSASSWSSTALGRKVSTFGLCQKTPVLKISLLKWRQVFFFHSAGPWACRFASSFLVEPREN